MSYPSDLTDKQWNLIEHHFQYGNDGKSRKHSKRAMVNAVFYVIKTGCQWRFLPQEFSPWKSVYSFDKHAQDKGQWDIIMRDLVAKSRIHMGRAAQPSYSLIDSQSVKTTGAAAERGIDGGKKG